MRPPSTELCDIARRSREDLAPELQFELTLERDDVETIVAPGFVTTISTISGTHIGEWNGWAPTGRRFSIRNVQVLGFRDGLASDRWGATDEYGIAEQLGLVHPPR